MNVACGFRRWIVVTLLTMVGSAAGGRPLGAEEAAPEATAPLRWTPHRAAATTPDPAATVAPATVAPTVDEAEPVGEPAAPPARLSPAPDTRRAPAEAPSAPSRTPRPAPRTIPPATAEAPAPWPSPNREPGVSPGTVRARGAARRDGTPTFLGLNLFRSPQGDAARPLFGGEPVPSRDGVRTAAASGPEGLRFMPQRPGQQGPRVAMAPDGSPSVVARLPGSSMPTASMPRPRVKARRVADQPTPAELPSPTTAPRAQAGRPTPAEGETIVEEPGVGFPDEGNLSFGDEGPIGFGDDGMDGGYPGAMPGPGFDGGFDGGGMMFPEEGFIDPEEAMLMDEGFGPEGPWMGEVQMHIPSFYDDPYACEDDEFCPGCYPWWDHDGRILAFFRRLGRPYYGWRWYRDFTASAGVTSFQNVTDLGIHGNYGFNEYVNWSMPFWNAFGVGWQVGVRGVQADFQQTKITQANGTAILSTQSRNQVFLTTGFFTRAFEGRGLQGGAVWDFLQDDWYDTVSASQVRGEVSYVWGYNEFGFWGAFNTYNQNGLFAPGRRGNQASMDTLDLYTGFYRLQFGDANELKIWGGASGQGDNLIGTLVRAPMSRSLALEGTFTYLIPRTANTVTLPTGEKVNFSEQAWNLSANIVWYPACRARRSLASPYRPLFDVADNGSMISTFSIPRR